VKLFGILALIGGLLAGTLLIAHFGIGAVAGALLDIGWTGFLVVNLVHLAIVALCGIAWFVLVPAWERPRAWVFIWGRLVRDGGSELLPLSQIGGLVMGGRAASLAGLPGRIAAASSVVDVTMEFLAQLAFAAISLAILAALHPEAPFIRAAALLLVAALVVALLFVIAQHRGFALLERMAGRISRQWTAGAAWAPGAIQQSIHRIYARRHGLAAGFLLHLLCWVASAVEAWLALLFMGSSLGLAAVVAIEGLLYATRGIAFAVPAAVGIQEGAYIVLGGLFGLPPDTALALSLLKRARGILQGAPPLLLWQLAETRKLLRRPSARQEGL
jgi:glycosyltransferase 2 family protein